MKFETLESPNPRVLVAVLVRVLVDLMSAGARAMRRHRGVPSGPVRKLADTKRMVRSKSG